MNVRSVFVSYRYPVSVLLALVFALTLVFPAAAADPLPDFDYTSPVFDLSVQPDQSLLVSDSGAGVVELRNGKGQLVVSLPGVTGTAPVGNGVMYAVTGDGDPATGWRVFRIAGTKVEEIANLLTYEETYDPDGTGEINSNPFDIAAINGEQVLVADAGANALYAVDKHGKIEVVATFPEELVSTSVIQGLAGCPDAPEELAFICGFPAMIPAQAVSTSVAIGPDGAYYVSELKGFPGPVGESRVWRVEPGTRGAHCGTDAACSVALDGFTGIVDLSFGPDGTLYVVEIDEASSVAVEAAFFIGFHILQGGTVNACSVSTGACSVVATGLFLPLSAAAVKDGTVYAAVNALIPGAAQVIALP